METGKCIQNITIRDLIFQIKVKRKNVWRSGSARTRWESSSDPQTQEAKGKRSGLQGPGMEI